MKPRFSNIRILSLLLLFLVVGASAQNDQKIAEQRKAIAALEKKIAAEEAQISKLKKGRATTEERARRLARQIESRNQLITENEREAALLREEIVRTNGVADSLQQALDKNREQYRLLAREAYRNYRQNNYLSYLFSSSDFTQMARRLAAMREMAALRERKLKHI
ncbi:MAG: peptidase, partial [Alistipes sp.]|nr:peptidase [Alistipes sp.]